MDQVEVYCAFMRKAVPNAVEVFTKGNCFMFAALLDDRFPGGRIVDDGDHAAYIYKGRCYDITGAIDFGGYETNLRGRSIIEIMNLTQPRYEPSK